MGKAAFTTPTMGGWKCLVIMESPEVISYLALNWSLFLSQKSSKPWIAAKITTLN